MNDEIQDEVIDFMNHVGWYISMEYGVEYNSCWGDKHILNNVLYPLMSKYYMGGNTVPETAHEVVNLVKQM